MVETDSVLCEVRFDYVLDGIHSCGLCFNMAVDLGFDNNGKFVEQLNTHKLLKEDT
jgi:hypothetical protein